MTNYDQSKFCECKNKILKIHVFSFMEYDKEQWYILLMAVLNNIKVTVIERKALVGINFILVIGAVQSTSLTKKVWPKEGEGSGQTMMSLFSKYFGIEFQF